MQRELKIQHPSIFPKELFYLLVSSFLHNRLFFLYLWLLLYLKLYIRPLNTHFLQSRKEPGIFLVKGLFKEIDLRFNNLLLCVGKLPRWVSYLWVWMDDIYFLWVNSHLHFLLQKNGFLLVLHRFVRIQDQESIYRNGNAEALLKLSKLLRTCQIIPLYYLV